MIIEASKEMIYIEEVMAPKYLRMALLHERQSHYPFGHGELNEMSPARLSQKVHTGSIQMSQSEYLAALEADSSEELELALKVALDAGYRYFDTAVQYNNEQIIGKVLEKYFQNGCLKRSDVFISSKLPFYGHRQEDAERHILESLKRLRVDYIDLYLLHGPYPCKADAKGDLVQDDDGQPIPDLVPHIETWRVLEKFYRMGKIKALGVSNFNRQQLLDLYHKADIKPHNLQVECHVLWPQDDLLEFCQNIGITMTAYCPTGLCETLESAGSSQENLSIKHSLVLELAKKYNKTPAQKTRCICLVKSKRGNDCLTWILSTIIHGILFDMNTMNNGYTP
uniref:NADP-dependent oxidoreductase domain-containing protein n=1 Tax=Acrobeloides nanus TaxID=290746 RepID=A0A914C8J5_9BILA